MSLTYNIKQQRWQRVKTRMELVARVIFGLLTGILLLVSMALVLLFVVTVIVGPPR
jgi:hypothetical protein